MLAMTLMVLQLDLPDLNRQLSIEGDQFYDN